MVVAVVQQQTTTVPLTEPVAAAALVLAACAATAVSELAEMQAIHTKLDLAAVAAQVAAVEDQENRGQTAKVTVIHVAAALQAVAEAAAHHTAAAGAARA